MIHARLPLSTDLFAFGATVRTPALALFFALALALALAFALARAAVPTFAFESAFAFDASALLPIFAFTSVASTVWAVAAHPTAATAAAAATVITRLLAGANLIPTPMSVAGCVRAP